MEKDTPPTNKIFSSLFKADLIVQWRNRRASIMSIIVPIVILISWKSIIEKMGAPFAISSCITIGLMAVGLMGYANTTARDREQGVFQRLRVTPAGTRDIMMSRIVVQLIQMAIMTILVFIVAYFVDKITLSISAYILALFASILCGIVYLGLGLAIVGLATSAEIVNSITRLIYIALIVVGTVGELGVLGSFIKNIVMWSPYGTVKDLLLASMVPSTWNPTTWLTLLVTLVYAFIFTYIGVKWFRWSSR